MPTKIFHVAVASGILPLANIYIYTEKERETERERERRHTTGITEPQTTHTQICVLKSVNYLASVYAA